uniref:Uncharacterized protein n=1 Tax=Tanacetum cinerariifolium TaxID=118510 RepID=A0A6L2KEV2_TANCI|nr:hypothetical protein [Tanacetum cinerariifolium]
MLIEKRTHHVGMYPIVLTTLIVKHYNSEHPYRLHLSTSSSTLIIDDDNIPELKQLKTDESSAACGQKIVKAAISCYPLQAYRGKEIKTVELEDSDAEASFVVEILLVTTWEDLVDKFVQKFYQLSYNNEEMETDEDDNPDDVTEIFKIEGNLFDLETPLCKAFNEFNYLLKIDKDSLTFDVQEIKTYEEHEYELNNNMTGDLGEPCADVVGFCNDAELPEMVRVGCMTYFQDNKWLEYDVSLGLGYGVLTPYTSRFITFLDNKLEEGDRISHSTDKRPYVRPMIPNLDKPTEQILEPLSKMIKGNKKQYIADDDRVDIQTKNAGYGGNVNRNAGRQNMNQSFIAGTENDESNQIVQPMKDVAGSNLKDKENDFMLDNSYEDETLEELTAAVIMMAQIQSANDTVASEPSYDAKAVSEVNASTRVHEQVNHVQRKTIIHTSDDDKIDYNIIFDDPYVENNGGIFEHDSTAHDEYHDIKILAYNV